jgi:predicted nucleic acid-binding protein
MRAPDVAGFRDALPSGSTVLLDTNILIYHLEGLEPYATLTRALIERLAEAEIGAVISALTVAELLAGPYRDGDLGRVETARQFVEQLPGAQLAELGLAVADRAAWLRGHGLRMPDAVILATGIVHGADRTLTNDPGLRRDIDGAPQVVLLDEFC